MFNEWDLYRLMFRCYFAELSACSSDISLLSITKDQITEDYLQNKYSHPYYILDERDEVIGFFNIQEKEIAEGTDYAIEQFYIKPEYRNLGYGKRAISQYIEERREQGAGRFSMLVYRQNSNALRFWANVAKEVKAEDVTNKLHVSASRRDLAAFAYEVS